jgi:uncharacterized membrane protein YphA (DoxX/SURF4 family)
MSHSPKKLDIGFYDRKDVLKIARDLLGKILVTQIDGVRSSGRIVETEAYAGVEDKACHAFGGRRTSRSEDLYGAPGTIYIYICYGMHHLFNVITNKKGIPHAVLIRALEPLALAGAAWVLAGSLRSQPPNTWSLGLSADQLTTIGRFVFGACMVVFGAQHFMYVQFIATLVPSWLPLHVFWTYFFGVALIAAGISIVTGIQARLAATLLGVMFLLWVVVLHAPRVAASPHNGDEWSSLFVALAMCGSCFIIAAAAASKERSSQLAVE